MDSYRSEKINVLRDLNSKQTVGLIVRELIDQLIINHDFSCVVHSNKLEDFWDFYINLEFSISTALRAGGLKPAGYDIMDCLVSCVYGKSSDSVIVRDGYSDEEVITRSMNELSQKVGLSYYKHMIAVRIDKDFSFRRLLINYVSQPFSAVVFRDVKGTGFKPRGAILEVCDGDAFLVIA